MGLLFKILNFSPDLFSPRENRWTSCGKIFSLLLTEAILPTEAVQVVAILFKIAGNLLKQNFNSVLAHWVFFQNPSMSLEKAR